MDDLIPKKDFAKFLYCYSLLEEKIAKAYEHVAKLADDRLVGGLLGFIARDSFKHAECFMAVIEWLSGGFQVCFSECEEVWCESWKTLVMNAEKILEKSEISSKELASLINGLMKLESFVAEEYLIALHVKLVELMADDAKINLGHFKAVFEWIIEDEKRHEQILTIIEDLLTKRVN